MHVLQLIEEYSVDGSEVLNLSQQTVKTNKYVLKKIFRDLNCEDVTELTIRAFDDLCAERKRNGMRPTSVNTVRRIMRGFLRWCALYRDLKVVDYRFIRKVKEPKRSIKFLDPDDVQTVISSTDDDLARLAISLLYETGMRIGELTTLTVENIDFSQNEISVVGKGDKERTVYFSAELRQLLVDYLEVHGIATGRIFKHRKRNRYNPKGLGERLQKAFAECEIKMTPHWLRHTHGTVLARNGAALQEISEHMGHTRIDVTMIYIHVTSDEVKLSRERHLTKLCY